MNVAREHIAQYNQLQKECDAIYHAAAVRSGLSDCAFWILYMVRDAEGPPTQSELCERASMSRKTVNSALKKLEREGFVQLEPTSERKGKAISLTAAGQTLVDQCIAPVAKAEEIVCASFGEDDRELFLGLFQSLVKRLGEEIGRLGEGRS